MFGSGLRDTCFALKPGGMHLCSTFDIILALLFAAKPPPFAALFERQFGPLAAVFARGIILFPTANA